MTRPLLTKTIAELEESADRNRTNRAELELLNQELTHRSTQRAQQLRQKIRGWIGALEKGELDETDMEAKTTRSIDPQAVADTEGAVAELRARLIDLSRKSPLINFRHGGRSATILRIVDERPDLVYDAIHDSGMRFDPLPDTDTTPQDEETDEFRIAYERGRLTDPEFLKDTDNLGEHEDDIETVQIAERALRSRIRKQLALPHLDYGKSLDIKAFALANGVDPSFDLASSDDERDDHHEDDKLRVLLTEKELQKRLKSIWDRYRLHYRETGIHTLYLAFGFVQWEDESSRGANFSPVLLLAVELHREKKRTRYEYTLRPHDEGLQVNIALIEKMRVDWGLVAPELREEESPESYFVRLRAVLEEGRDLSLRQFVTLAVLPFPQMVLWRDLDPDNWDRDAFGSHRLLPGLMGAAAMEGNPSPGEPYNIDEPEWIESAPRLVRPADASQHSALIETAAGADLAIEGPPGTGKSETITNIIADAVSRGQKVLFVAEKQAALQVVANRLRDTGLGALALELHGENANRTAVYDGLRERLATTAQHDLRHLTLQRGRLEEKRELLRTYLARMHDRPGSLDRSVYNLVWRHIHLSRSIGADLCENLENLIDLEDASVISEEKLQRVRGKLDVLGQSLVAMPKDPRTLWLSATRLPVFDQSAGLRMAEAAAQRARAVADGFAGLHDLAPLALPAPHDSLTPAMEQLRRLVPFIDVSENEAKTALQTPEKARTALRLQSRHRLLGEKLSQDLDDPVRANRDVAAKMDDHLRSFEAPPASLAEARSQLARIASTIAKGNEASKSLESLLDMLSLPTTLPLSSLITLAKPMTELGRQPAAVRALMRRELADPMVEIAIAEQSAAATQIQQEREGLEQAVQSDALDADPAELEGLADTLENTGFFARLFSGEYKSAMRRSARLLRDSAERMQAAEALRNTAKFRTSELRFRHESAARTLFPEILWKGSDSDFESLEAARSVLRNARFELGHAQLDAALAEWLALDSDGRDKVARAADQVNDALSDLSAQTQNDLTFSEAVAQATTRAEALDALIRLLEQLGAREGGAIQREGENLAERLTIFDACEAEFTRLCQDPLLQWIEGIGIPLDGLGRALEQSDTLRSAPDPLCIATALQDSQHPVQLSASLSSLSEGAAEAIIEWEDSRLRLSEATGLTLQALDLGNIGALDSWYIATEKLGMLAADRDGARAMAKLLSDKADLDDFGVAALCEAAIDGQADTGDLADAYELHVVSRLLQNHLNTDGQALQRMGGLNLAEARRQFVKIDKELHELEAQSILAARLKDQPEEGIGYGRKTDFTEMSLLANELGLRRPRTPMRDVIHRAGNALQTLKPVWMMSPASAAQYIRPGAAEFDMLIMDEASQMRPEFAISAIMRARQFVVVGDTKQLPPSNHFSSNVVREDEDDTVGVDADAESILDVANQRFRRKRRLKWHYRSRHESLIKFSNRQFYDNDLVVFPSPTGDGDDVLGAKLFYVPDLKPGTYYESSINQKEAEAVLEEALRLMTNYPEYSIGIAAMNAQQTELLNNEFDRLRLKFPAIDRYVEAFGEGVEEFFIKNLENVQGDERDIILVSTVYGPGPDGGVRQNFGLMNREVGWRRLNVLVTRAKHSIRVFTSLRPADIKVTPTSSAGVRAFHDYIAYLNQQPVVDDLSKGDAESDFEHVVAERLREEGYECIPQVGVNDFRIDIGVRHPACGDTFIAGIECDGAPFHSGFTVRDRDRIRQQVLEGLNWKIWRIWSVDWYQDPEREMAKLLQWLDELREGARITGSGLADADSGQAIEASNPKLQPDTPVEGGKDEAAIFSTEPEGRALRPVDGIEWYELSKGEIYTVWTDTIRKGIIRVVSRATEAPRLYGDKIAVQRTKYEASIDGSEETLSFDDLYAAVRFVGKTKTAELAE